MQTQAVPETHEPVRRHAQVDACRLCSGPLDRLVVDLGTSPLCENYIAPQDYDRMEPFFPLRVFLCERCFLVQLRDYVGSEAIFGDYAYFSSYSDSWVRHAATYVDAVAERFRLGADSFVVEVAGNDGCLLQHVVARGIGALGIEPARNVAGV